MHLRVKKTGDLEFSSELLVFFLALGEGGIATTSEYGSRLGDSEFMLAFPTTQHVGVDPEIASGFANAFGLGEFDGCKFVFGCVGFVSFHCCLHCEAVLVVHKILYISLFWAYQTGELISSRKPIRELAHGRLEQSVFRVGLDALERFLRGGLVQAASWFEVLGLLEFDFVGIALLDTS